MNIDNKKYVNNVSSANSTQTNNILLSLHPGYDTGNQEYKNLHQKDHYTLIKAFLGFFIFILFIVFPIVLIFKSLKNQDLLLAYLANLDLLATVISFKNGPFNLDLFRYLYIDPRPFIGYLNQNLINYIVLLSISYIIIKTSIKTKNVSDGLGKASIIFIITYLFPGRILSEFMNYMDNYVTSHFNINHSASWTIIFILGIMLGLFFIIIETLALKHLTKYFSKFYSNIVLKYLNL